MLRNNSCLSFSFNFLFEPLILLPEWNVMLCGVGIILISFKLLILILKIIHLLQKDILSFNFLIKLLFQRRCVIPQIRLIKVLALGVGESEIIRGIVIHVGTHERRLGFRVITRCINIIGNIVWIHFWNYYYFLSVNQEL